MQVAVGRGRSSGGRNGNPARGRGGGRGNFGGRLTAGGMNNDSSSDFKGRCDELKGHIIDCGLASHAEKYNTTMIEIMNYIGSSFVDGEPVVRSIKTEQLVKIERPNPPPDLTDIIEKNDF